MILSVKRMFVAILLAAMLFGGLATLVPQEAEAHAGTCGHWWPSTGGTWHYANYSHTIYHSVVLATTWYSNGNHFHKYKVKIYYWYSGYGWYYDHYTVNTRWC